MAARANSRKPILESIPATAAQVRSDLLIPAVHATAKPRAHNYHITSAVLVAAILAEVSANADIPSLFDLKGSTDCSSNPDYPAGEVGDAYYVSVAGKIGGASGKTVEVGDVYVCKADAATGAEAAVGTSWFVVQANLTGITAAGLAFIQAVDAAAQKTLLSLAKADVGLGNVDNTADASKSIATTQLTGVLTPTQNSSEQAVTATADGSGTGTIAAGTTQATVTSDDANKIVILPAPVVGRPPLIIHAGATGFELRSSDPTTIAINGGTGADAESAIAADSTLFMFAVSATAWKGFFLDADGDVAKVEAAAAP